MGLQRDHKTKVKETRETDDGPGEEVITQQEGENQGKGVTVQQDHPGEVSNTPCRHSLFPK